VQHKDWMGLSDKTENILSDPASGKKMGKNAREKVLEMMDPKSLELHEQNEYSKMLRKFSMKTDPIVRAIKKL